MPHRKYFRHALSFTLAGIFSCTVFAADPPTSGKAISQEKSTSRIRLFGQNAVMVKYYPNSKCAGGDSVTVSGSLGSAFSSFIGTVKNQSIGMPETPNTTNLSTRDGFMSKAYFREYEIAAGEPVTIAMSFHEARAAAPIVTPGTSVNANVPSLGSVSCRRIITTFVPEKGKDYEGALNIHSSEGVCVQTINEVSSMPNGIVLTPVAVEKAKECDTEN